MSQTHDPINQAEEVTGTQDHFGITWERVHPKDFRRKTYWRANTEAGRMTITQRETFAFRREDQTVVWCATLYPTDGGNPVDFGQVFQDHLGAMKALAKGRSADARRDAKQASYERRQRVEEATPALLKALKAAVKHAPPDAPWLADAKAALERCK